MGQGPNTTYRSSKRGRGGGETVVREKGGAGVIARAGGKEGKATSLLHTETRPPKGIWN